MGPWWRRVAVASVVYLGAAALSVENGRGVRTWALSLLAIAWITWVSRKQVSITGWAVAVTLATCAPSRVTDGLDLAGALAAFASLVVAARAIEHVAAPPGLLAERATATTRARGGLRAFAPLGVLAAVWAPLVAARGLARVRPYSSEGGLFTLANTLSLLAPLVGFGVLAMSLQTIAKRRGLELGVLTRVQVALTGLAFSGAAMVGLVALDSGPTEGAGRIARAALVVACALVARAAREGDAAVLARRARRGALLTVGAATVGGLMAMIANGQAPRSAGWILVTAALTAGVTAALRQLERPLRPEGGVWLDAFATARLAAGRLDPDDALRGALAALRPNNLGAMPTLYLRDPPRALRVDAAGYGHEKDALLPEGLLTLATREPEATLRREVLDALVVRRPDLRPYAAWMEAEGALAATVIAREGDIVGLLTLPAGSRSSALALEETLALKELADTLASPLESRARLARSLAREHAEAQRANTAEDATALLAQAHEREAGRHLHLAARLARPAEASIYSPSARLTLDAVQRAVAQGTSMALVTPSGVDPVPFLARAHREGRRAGGPLVLIDGTASAEHVIARWSDARTSPMSLADGGLLVLLDAAALPLEAQRLVARALAPPRAEAPGATLDVTLAVTGNDTPRSLVASGRLDPQLAALLGEPIAVPRLRDRAEDLRPLLVDRLAREGLRTKGTAVGLETAALVLLVEHTYPGETAELDALVIQLVAGCRGDIVRASDVERLGLRGA